MTQSEARVLVVGYGVVGKRVADAVNLQKDMTVSGVVDVSPGTLLTVASERQFPIYGGDKNSREVLEAANISTRGTLADALGDCDVAIDTTPKGVARGNVSMYTNHARPYILNGGEKANAVDISFNALANYQKALNASSVRVVSCNTTALCRLLVSLTALGEIDDAFVVAVRRAADPVKTNRGPINAIIPSLGGLSHHAADVQEVLPKVPIKSMAIKVSNTLSHVHVLRVQFASKIRIEEVLETFLRTPRIMTVSGEAGLISNAHILEWARDQLRPRGDIWEVAIWEDSIFCEGRELIVVYCVHMEAIAVPENVDAIRAVLNLKRSAGESMELTDKALGCYQQQADYLAF